MVTIKIGIYNDDRYITTISVIGEPKKVIPIVINNENPVIESDVPLVFPEQDEQYTVILSSASQFEQAISDKLTIENTPNADEENDSMCDKCKIKGEPSDLEPLDLDELESHHRHILPIVGAALITVGVIGGIVGLVKRH